MTLIAALDRTLLLMRDVLVPEVSDDQLLEALTGTRVSFLADHGNLKAESCQHAVVSGFLLSARLGVQLRVDVPNVLLRGYHAPLCLPHLHDALLEIGGDILPTATASISQTWAPPDLTVLFGDSTQTSDHGPVVRVCGGGWEGAIVPGAGSRWLDQGNPFGGLAAAGLVAGEVFKAAMRKLRRFAANLMIFDELFAPVQQAAVTLAPPGTPLHAQLGQMDVISAGAICQAALYALCRIPNVTAVGRLIEPDENDASNLNRNAFLRYSRIGIRKAEDVQHWLPSGTTLEAVYARYDETTLDLIGPLAPTVLVGVDHIPTRWLVQQQWPNWLAVGASTHFSAMASYHTRETACAGCLHPRDEVIAGHIPTISFVSHWAGLWLAALVAQRGGRFAFPPDGQQVFGTLLRPDLPSSIWKSPIAPNPSCPVGCPCSR